MKLFIRSKKGGFINYMHNMAELKSFQENYIPNTKILIGDLSMFNKNMLNILLKFLEENPKIDCYSSKDIADRVLLSRFSIIEKVPIQLEYLPSVSDFIESSRDFNAIQTFMPHINPNTRLRLLGAPNHIIEIITNIK